MSRPKRVKIGLHTYPVAWVCGIIDGAEGGQLCGEVCHNTGDRGITISTDKCNDERETFLHEIIHSIVVDRDLDICMTDDCHMEHLVNQMAVGLMCVLRDNHSSLAAYLTERV